MARNVARFFVYWLLLFQLQRLLFSVHYFSRIVEESKGDYWAIFIHSFHLDLSTIGFLAMATLPFYLFYLLSSGKTQKIAFTTLKIQHLLLLLIVCLIHCGEINVYEEWNHKLTTRVFMHLTHPSEVFRTATGANYIFFFLYLAVELFVGVWLLKKIYRKAFETTYANWKKWVYSLSFFVFYGGLSFLAARGGWQPIPITINSAIFSHSSIVNDISINSTYFFGDNLLLFEKVDLSKYLHKVSSKEAEQYAENMLAYPKVHKELFLSNKRPNIVFIVLESWSAEAISYSGLCKGATPYFDQLIDEGLYFDHFYAGSGTSEIGNSGIFGGIPALPQVSITLYPDKSRKITTLNQVLKPYGYSSSFLFGGDLAYGNIGGFFINHDFDKVMDEKVFPSSLERGKLNVYDPDLYQRFLQEIRNSKGPFMQCVFTGSTHAPYDIPEKWKGFWKGDESGFMDGLHYSDFALHQFIEKCKKEPWFDTTLFVFVADHGRATPINIFPYKPNFYRIPLLFWGKPLKEEYTSKKIHTIGSHSDIAATLLYQMGIDSQKMKWSKDLMNPNVPQFAMYSSTLGYGYLDSLGDFFYYMDSGTFESNTYPDSLKAEKMHQCQLYLKVLWDEFLKL